MCAFAFTHLIFSRSAGGFHYDEAWAALYSHRIAFEPGFWPLTAMSPYTSPWSHYWTALFFRIFGTSLEADRLSGFSMVAGGVLLLCLALRKLGQFRAAAIFPWVLAFFSAAVMNERFAIEINTFHVFCLGLFCWGASFRLNSYDRLKACSPISDRASANWMTDLAIGFALVAGITSHILFLAPALAAFSLIVWRNALSSSAAIRRISASVALIFCIFALRIHLLIPEKDKSSFLVAAAAAVLALSCFSMPRSWTQAILRQSLIHRVVLGVFMAAGAVAAFFVLFFTEGSWAAAFFNGGQSQPSCILWPELAGGVALAFFWRNRTQVNPTQVNSTQAKPTHVNPTQFFQTGDILTEARQTQTNWLEDIRTHLFLRWSLLVWIFTAILATKPAPRYFEICFILLAIALSLVLSSLPRRQMLTALALWICAGSLQMSFNYFHPILSGAVPERSFHFLFFRDNSSDTLSKQNLADILSSANCRFDQIQSDDDRIMQPLRFLSIGDWNISTGTPCKFGETVRIERVSQLAPSLLPQAELDGPFAILKK